MFYTLVFWIVLQPTSIFQKAEKWATKVSFKSSKPIGQKVVTLAKCSNSHFFRLFRKNVNLQGNSTPWGWCQRWKQTLIRFSKLLQEHWQTDTKCHVVTISIFGIFDPFRNFEWSWLHKQKKVSIWFHRYFQIINEVNLLEQIWTNISWFFKKSKKSTFCSLCWHQLQAFWIWRKSN